MMATFFDFIFQILTGESPCRRPKFYFGDGDTPSLPKQKSPAGFASGAWKFPARLTFRVLEPFARARLAVFLALFHARIAREQALGLERATQRGIGPNQRPGNPMPHRAGLSVRAAAGDIDARVEFFRHAGEGQRLRRRRAQGLERKIIFKWPAVHGDFAGAGREPDAGDGGLAPTGAEKFDFSFRCHLSVEG